MNPALFSNAPNPFTTSTAGIATGDNNNIFRIRDIAPGIDELNMNDGKFHKVLSMFKRDQAATQVKYEWGEKDVQSVQGVFTTAKSASATDPVVDSAAAVAIQENYVVQNTESGELMYVTANTSGTLTVIRGVFGSATAPIAEGDTFITHGAQLPEGGNANTGAGIIPTDRFNYIQRWSESVSASDIQEVVAMVDGVGQITQAMVDKELYVQRQINNAIIWGQRFRGTVNGKTVTTTAGFVEQASFHELNLQGNGGLLEWQTMNRFANPLFEHSASSRTKHVFCGEHVWTALSHLFYERNNFIPAVESEIGADVGVITTDNGGRLEFVRDIYGFASGTGNAGSAIVVDMQNVALKDLTGQPLGWRMDVQQPNSHEIQHEFWGTESLKVSHRETHAVIRGAGPN